MGDLSQLNLFTTKSDLRIRKITKGDVEKESDIYNTFKELIKKNENMYPDISRWFKSKVAPGIKTNERIAYLGLNNEDPIVTAILKKGKYSKICHLQVDEKFQSKKIGELFFAMMAIDIRSIAEETHFTLPESIWTNKMPFFKTFGFKEARKADRQYRNFEQELKCSVPYKTLWKNTLEKLPSIIDTFARSCGSIFNGLLVSIKPEYLNKLEKGEKVVEIRRKFNPKWRGHRVTLYCTSPVKAIYGYADIEKVDKGSQKYIWDRYWPMIGVEKKEFYDYSNGSNQLYAIQLKNYEKYLAPLFLDQISYLINRDLKPPQSYLILENNKDWIQGVYIAELLHGKFQVFHSKI